jgi:4-amino-4-deoxy-L-arabinose transferase-like glycosyltransferase
MTGVELPLRSRAARAAGPPPQPRRRRRLLGGAAPGPAWYRPALVALLVAAALLYLWDLSSSGYANSFYAAAVQAGSKSWKAWFFGSLDSSNFITVDKPPGALWVMGLSARIFGFSSWSLLVPQALEGVAAVGLLAATVRRAAGPAAGLIAGAALALTPAAVLIFRFDNPDAFLVLLLVAAAYCVTRALDGARTRWLVAAGAAVGFAFLTKSGQALLPVPAFGLAYLVAAPTSLRRRVGQLLVAGLAIVAAAGWWILAVLLWPAAGRPYIGGSTDNNPLQLAFGYNGLERLLGQGGGAGSAGAGGAGAGSSFGGATGLQRLFTGEFGLEISWLLPAALLLLAAGAWLTWGRQRTDPARAAFIVWGGWLLVTAGTFSFMKGIIHPYYTVALAPAIGAVVGIGSVLLWQRRVRGARSGRVAAGLVLAAAVALTCGWDVALLRSDASFHPWVAAVAIAAAALAILALAAAAVRGSRGRRLAGVAAIMTAIAFAIPTSAWALGTAATPHTGSIPAAVATGSADGGGLGGGLGGGRFAGAAPGGGRAVGKAGGSVAGTAGEAPGRHAAFGQAGSGQAGSGHAGSGQAGSGQAGSGTSGQSAGRPAGAAGMTLKAGAGGLAAGGGQASVSSALRTALEKTTTRWAAATVGSQSAASLELATGGKAVMAIGGFTGTDPAPTLAQFKAYVAAGDISYFIAGGQGGGPGGGSGTSSQITSWVEAHYTATTIGGDTVYVLHKQ